MHQLEHRRQRAKRPDVLLARQAAGAARPVRDKIGRWQAAAVFLKARLERDGAGQAAITLETQLMLRDVLAARDDLLLAAGTMPEEVTQHSRFQDTFKALGSLAALLKTALPPGIKDLHTHLTAGSAETLELQLICDFCGTHNRLTIQGRPPALDAALCCSLCGGRIRTGD
jgi:hypothetical protein